MVGREFGEQEVDISKRAQMVANSPDILKYSSNFRKETRFELENQYGQLESSMTWTVKSTGHR